MWYISQTSFYTQIKKYEFQNINIGLFSGNDTSMAGYFVGMHRDMSMIKALFATINSSELNIISLNSKLSKVVSYIRDNKSWEKINVILK